MDEAKAAMCDLVGHHWYLIKTTAAYEGDADRVICKTCLDSVHWRNLSIAERLAEDIHKISKRTYDEYWGIFKEG